MKNVITLLVAVLFTANVFAQAPQKMSYQAVIRNTNNNLVVSTSIGMRISIIQGSLFGASVYVETQTSSTNTNGLVSVEVGAGTIVTGSFSTINWANGPYFIKTETDPLGGTAYTITGTSQLNSVPYALYAANSTSYNAGAGISVSGSTITNTAPDQTVAITGVGITNVTGTYPNLTVNTPAYTAGIGISITGNTITNTAPSVIPAGTIMAYGGSIAPTGWLLCDGSTVSRTTYAGLYTAVGNNFGSGNGSTTFNLPDFRGRFLRGVDGAASIDPDKATRTAMNSGGSAGNNVGSVQTGIIESHSHTFSASTFSADNQATSNNRISSGSSTIWCSTCPANVANTASIQSSGGGETRPVNAYVLYIIKD